MENSTLRKIILQELYDIANTELITEEGLTNDPVNIIPLDGTDPSKLPIGANINTKKGSGGGQPASSVYDTLTKKSGVDPAKKKAAAKKLQQAAMRCGWGNDIKGYKESGWECKQEFPDMIATDREKWRAWLQKKHPEDWKKIGLSDPTDTRRRNDIEGPLYFKHIGEYSKHQKAHGETTPGVDDEDGFDISNLTTLQWIVIGIAASSILSGISGSFVVRGLISLIRRGRRNQASRKTKNKDRSGSQYKSFTNFLRLSTHDIANQIAKEPAAMKAEMQAVAKKSNAELRTSVEKLTGKKPTDRQIEEMRSALNNPALTRDAIVSARKMAIEDFMKNKGNFTADEVIQLMTKSERVKYEKYVRQLERRRKPKN